MVEAPVEDYSVLAWQGVGDAPKVYAAGSDVANGLLQAATEAPPQRSDRGGVVTGPAAPPGDKDLQKCAAENLIREFPTKRE